VPHAHSRQAHRRGHQQLARTDAQHELGTAAAVGT
jgi:hypothetical protein